MVTKPMSVLLVDDEPGVLVVMRRWCESLGYSVREAADADAALVAMSENPAGIVVCDVGMPGRDGLWLVRCLLETHPDTAVVMYSGSADVDAAMFCLNHGVVDYLVKPFAREHLRVSLRRGGEAHREAIRTRDRSADRQRRLRGRMTDLTSALVDPPVETEAEFERGVASLLSHDHDAFQRARRVADLAAGVARTLGACEEEARAVRQAAWLDDVGVVEEEPDHERLPAAALLGARNLDLLRRSLMADALARNPFLAEAAVIVRSVPERFDGTGHPLGLQAEEIPLGSRVVAAAAAFDAMTHPEGRRWARTPPEAIFDLRRCRGTQFDPVVVDALIELVWARWTGHRQPSGLSPARKEPTRCERFGSRQPPTHLTIAPAAGRHGLVDGI